MDRFLFIYHGSIRPDPSVVLRRPEPGDPVMPPTVDRFALRDATGTLHTPADWRDDKAVVLFVLGLECPVSDSFTPR